jgi:MATE family multidrug resistance protein
MKENNYKEHFKRNYLLAYPVVLSQLGHVLVGTVDSMMVGRVGTNELAAAAIANAVFSVMMMFGIGVSFGLTPLIAISDGRDETSRGAKLLKNSLVTNLFFGLLLSSMLLFGGYVLDLLDQPKSVVILAKPYLQVIGLSLIPFMFFQTFKQFAEGLSFTKQAMYISIAANIVNIFLNYILIFGAFGVAPMGLLGAGIATLIARVLMALAFFMFVYKATIFKKYWHYFRSITTEWPTVKELLNLGVPTGLQYIFEVGAFASAAIMIGWMGTIPLAAHQVAMNLASISYMMSTGISAAATVRVGNQLGKHNYSTMKIAGYTCFIMAAIFMIFTGIVFTVFSTWLPSLYTSDQDVITTAASLLIIAAIFQLSDGIQVVGLGVLRGLGDVKIPTLVTFTAYWIIGLPAGYLLAFKLNMAEKGVWYGLLIGLSITAVILFYRFRKKSNSLICTVSNEVSVP